MRILFVNEKLGWFGGVEQNISDTVLGLNARGHQCFLAWGEQTSRDPEAYGALFAGQGPCREAGATTGETLGRLCEQFAADVIYFHKIPQLPYRTDLPRGIPMVRMVHDHDLCCPRRHKYFFHNAHVCEHPAGWRCWLDLAWLERDRSNPLGVALKNLAAHSEERRRNQELDLCLVGSRFMQRELEMNGFSASRVQILPPVVNRTPTTPPPMSEEPEVLFVGQLIRGKGVDLLLQALALIKIPYRATIVGEGNARQDLEAQTATLGLKGKVHFTGWVANTDINAYYARARLLAVPARWPEPFGMIGLEAMHQGRPIVGFATGGIPDWLEDGHNGFVLPERDCSGFAAAITRLLTDRSLAERFGKQGWQMVQEKFSFDLYIQKLVSLLEGARA